LEGKVLIHSYMLSIFSFFLSKWYRFLLCLLNPGSWLE
jgi:hypothetical protein